MKFPPPPPRNPHLLLKYQATLACHRALVKNQPALAREAEIGLDELWQELTSQYGNIRDLPEASKRGLYTELQIYVADMAMRNPTYANAVQLQAYELV